MYPIGSKVVHPAYGAGVVVRVQEKHIGGVGHNYYVIDMRGTHSTRLLVPVQRAETIGLRHAGSADRLRQELADCQPPEHDDVERDFRTRQTLLREKLTSGSFSKVASAVWILCYLNTQRRLGITDRQMYSQGKDILAGELALATEQDVEAALAEIETFLEEVAPVEA